MKLFNICLNLLPVVNTQLLVGSQNDVHGCVLDGGYQWCETLSQCIRPWQRECPILQKPINVIGISDTDMNTNTNTHTNTNIITIPKNCASWNDGCNTCNVNKDGTLNGCTMMYCYTKRTASCLSYYKDSNQCNKKDYNGNCIDDNCKIWYDGCNTCRVSKNGLLCTRMYCIQPGKSECQDTPNLLKEGDICYRFCENGSETTINFRDKCPLGTQCKSSNKISIDTCGNNAFVCSKIGH